MQEHREGALGYFIFIILLFLYVNKKSAGPLGLKNVAVQVHI
jgi:hypothetical protein